MALSENPTLEEIVDEVERLNNLIVSRGGAQTITPSTSNKTLNKGYYKGNITIKGDSNLVASNILSGKSIFGVKGNVTKVTTVKAGDNKYYYDVDGKVMARSLEADMTNTSILRKTYGIQVEGSLRLSFAVSRSSSTVAPKVRIIQKRGNTEIFVSEEVSGFTLNLSYDLNVLAGDTIEIWANVYKYTGYSATLSKVLFKYA